MNIENLNKAFVEIVEKKEQMNSIGFPSVDYEQLVNEIQNLEREFMEEYGAYFEDAIFNIHDEYCPDNDVMLPLAYMASHYLKNENETISYDVAENEGILVETDDFPEIKTRLVLVPNPTRLILQGENKEIKQVVWTAQD